MEDLYFTILKLGIATLKTWAETQTPVPGIAEPNRVFKPPVGSPWVRIDFLPAQPWPAGLGVDALNENKGLFQFSLHYRDWETDRKSTRLNSSHSAKSRMPSSA